MAEGRIIEMSIVAFSMSCARDEAATNLKFTGDRAPKRGHLCEYALCDQEEVLCCEL